MLEARRPAGRGVRVRRRRLERDRPVPRLSRRPRRRSSSASRPAAAGRSSAITRRRCQLRQARRAARHAHDAALRRARPDPGDALDLGGPRLSRRRPRARVAASRSAASSTSRPATTRRSRSLEELLRGRGHPARARKLARAGGREALGRAAIGGARVIVGLSGRGDKDMPILAQYPQKNRARSAAMQPRDRIRAALARDRREARRAPQARRVLDGGLSRAARVPRSCCARSRASPTPSRSACRSATRWPTASRSSARASTRSSTA